MGFWLGLGGWFDIADLRGRRTCSVDARTWNRPTDWLKGCIDPLAGSIDGMPASLRSTACRGRRGLQYKSSNGTKAGLRPLS